MSRRFVVLAVAGVLGVFASAALAAPPGGLQPRDGINPAPPVNPTPASEGGPWTLLPTGSSRRRVVTGPAPGSQVLVQVAAVAGDATQSAWSDPILATTR